MKINKAVFGYLVISKLEFLHSGIMDESTDLHGR